MRKNILAILILTVVSSPAFSREQANNKIFREAYIIKALKKATSWQLKHPKHRLYDWTNSAFYAGVVAAYETTGSKKIYKALVEMGDANQWKAGPRPFHADDYAICQTYIDVYRIAKDKRMIEPTIEKVDKFMATPYEPYPFQEEIKKGDKTVWWWCDALFMGPPSLVKLGITLDNDKYLKLNDKLFKECYDLLYDKEEHLYARDLRYKWDNEGIEPIKEANGKKIFWSRGNGWVMGGLVRILKELPKDYPLRNFYINNYKEMAEKIASIQQPDGLWRASLLDPGSYPGGEGSGSGFYCYALAWGINNGILDKATYLPVVEKAWAGLTKLQKKNGMIGWIQPIGADPKKNFSSESWEVYGTGAFLLAGSEVIKLKR
ncbi:Rhamnogalacturonides degradation protein RhiN [hydrothermal vent metagenome]|uniref:Rhamnogalacturonides degradation protein RhiN n=1 Tax=hydrothermal vent metagenome TaxID=652676 RepID=A0A3B0UXJ7_9ZZZZ